MGHTYAHLLTHAVFSTKGRTQTITEDLKPRLFPYMGGIVRELGGSAIAINGTADHVHMFLKLPATVCVADALRLVKTNSSKWVHETWRKRSLFGWQTGYGAFSVSQSLAPRVVEYIAKQGEHHRRSTFQQEFLALLKRHGVEYDERYVWD